MVSKYNKKIKFFIILFVLIIIGLVICMLPQSYSKKQKKCQNEINSMSYDQLLDKIETIENIFLTNLAVDKKTYLEGLAIKKIACLINDETDQSIKNNIYNDTLAFVSQNFPDYYQTSSDYLKNYHRSSYDNFLNILLFNNYQDYCPEKLPFLCQKIIDDKKLEMAEGWCSEICSTMDQYRDNNSLLRDYILDFETEEVQINRRLYWALKLAFAFQYNDDDAATELCTKIDEINNAEGFACKTLLKRMEAQINYSCEQVNKVLSELLCTTKFDHNY